MKIEKLKSEAKTLKLFIETYCSNKHTNQKTLGKQMSYKGLDFSFTIELCPECKTMFEYSLQRLQNCPYEEKPRCRKCQNPCYEKPQWKKLAKIMRYSGLKLGLLKLKNRFFT